jgi:hypothetical protein
MNIPDDEYNAIVDMNMEKVEKLEYAKERYVICKSCEYFDNLFKLCKKCGCFMPVKTQFKRFSCPIEKWNKVV